MHKRSLTVAASFAAPLLLTFSMLTPLATAAPGSSVNGPHDGAPLGGSSMTRDHGFFTNTKDLGGMKPGDIIDVRELPYHAFGLPTPLNVVQIKFRTTNAQGQPTHGITSIVKPSAPQNGNLLSFHSVYDSLDPEHSPSRSIQGDVALGTVAGSAETGAILGFLSRGTTVAITDIEGQDAHFGAGPEYGTTTLDALRAALAEPRTGLSQDTKIGLLGYSGGAIATNWAAQLAPEYAPEINEKLVGAATGGLLVNPINNVKYIDGSMSWAGLMPMTLIGLSRSYGIDLSPYLSDYGKDMFAKLDKASISEVYGVYGGVTWKSLVKPEYANPASIPEVVDVVNKTNLGLAPNPTIPFYVGQSTNGVIDGTPVHPTVGTGDGVMVAGDVRSVAHKICSAGNPVKYEEFPLLAHTASFAQWYPTAALWMSDRFAGKPAPSDCGSIPQGNDLSAAEVAPKAPADAPQEMPMGSAGARNVLGS